MDDKLKLFGLKVDSLLKGKDMSREETVEMFREVLLDEQPDLQQGAFLAAITAKGMTPEELAGAWEAIYDIDTVKVTPDVDSPLVDNCGTGMDTMKTFNISTAASIIVAAGGVTLAKHGARAITSKCGVVDILEELGVQVDCEIDLVRGCIEKAGIGIFNGNSPKVHPTALFRILSRIRFGTILNMAGSLANPAAPKHGVRGVYSRELVLPVTETMREIGYERAVVFHGLNSDGSLGMDEVSTLGETFVAELHPDGRIETYSIYPDLFDIRDQDQEAILCSFERRDEAIQFVRILGGSSIGPRRDIVCLNAAPILFMMGKAGGWEEGFEMAQALIDDGSAIGKLKEWVEAQNVDPAMGMERLEDILAEAER